jgi:hypothetical protein
MTLRGRTPVERRTSESEARFVVPNVRQAREKKQMDRFEEQAV